MIFSFSTLVGFLCRTAFTIVPSYLQDRLTGTEPKPQKLSPTSALDGLRGIAALFVFFFHILFSYTQLVEFGYGVNEENRHVLQLPFLRLFHAGHAMVVVFFVVGGYVLSIKPMKLLQSRRQAALHETLVSSVFRRTFRLYLPAMAATFITMLTVYAGQWEYPRRFITGDQKYIYYSDIHPARRSTFLAQVWDWIEQTKLLTNIFTYYNYDGFLLPYYPEYDPHLWTVPFEFRSSLILALVTLVFSRCKTRVRIFGFLLAIMFCIIWGRWELVCFLGGALICMFDTISKESNSHDGDDGSDDGSQVEGGSINPTTANDHDDNDRDEKEEEDNDEEKQLPGRQQTIATDNTSISTAHLVIFVLGLYLLSTPNLDIGSTPGYGFLARLTPSSYGDKKRFPHTVGALLVTATLMRSSGLRRPFNSRIAQYLGKISYSLYIVHGPLIHMVGYSVTPNVWRALGMGGCKWWVGLVLGSSVLAVCVAVAADWFWRVVDGRSIMVSKKLENWCFYKEDHSIRRRP